MPFINWLCGSSKDDGDLEPNCRPVKKERTGKTHNDKKKQKKEKEKNNRIPNTCKLVSDGTLLTSPGPYTQQLIDLIPDSDLKEKFLKLQNESIQEQKDRQCKDLQIRRELEEVRQRCYRSEEMELRLQNVVKEQSKEIDTLTQRLQDCKEECESIKQDLQVARNSTNRLELLVSSLQDKPIISKHREDSTNGQLVEAVGTLVQLPRKRGEENLEIPDDVDGAVEEVKAAMRLLENFIGPRWQEFARQIDLPQEIIERNETEQRHTEIYWKIMSAWQKREDVTVTKIATVCQQLKINIGSDKPMSGQHRRTLDKNREKIVEQVWPKPMLTHMMKYLPIPTSLREYVTSADRQSVMVERLLDILPVLGDHAFPVFFLALTNTNHQHVADLLMENPMPEEHILILRKFENVLVSCSDSHRVVPCMAKYVTIPGCIHGYLMEALTRESKMRRLLEILPCFGHGAMDALIKALSDTGFKQVVSILKDKTGELQKLTKKETSTQMSPEDVCVLAQEHKAPLTGHRRSAKCRSDSADNSNTSNDDLLLMDDYYSQEMMTKEMEANAAMFEHSIEQQVEMNFECQKQIEFLNCMDKLQVHYKARVTE
ncbi:uncharacterized protein LOC132557772 [Ylistrum balloti]|uniref:uncharacterized protein LOC132557772 n=1 Tax=Ylistrum balloti TaxID=509963 RepID=UPI002905E5EB|nr:uncharacterized protein LOC132557772 [Ylistrum balloti]